MAETFDSLKGERRVKATDEAGIPKDAYGILPHRLYPKPGVVGSWMEAVALANKRIAGEVPPIKGSIDDESPELYRRPSSASPFGKTFAPQRASLDEQSVERLRAPGEVGGPAKDAPEAPRQEEPPAPASREPAPPPVADEQPQMPPVIASTSQYTGGPMHGDPKGRPGPNGLAGVPEMLPGDPFTDMSMYPAQALPPKPQEFVRSPGFEQNPFVQYVQVPVYRDRIVEKPVPVVKEVPVEKEVVREVVKDGPFEKWSKGRVRVQIATAEMAFTVSAIAVVRGAFGITVFLPTVGDSFGFVPRTGSKVRLVAKDLTVDTVFTGATFEIEELGVMGVVFVEDPSKNERMQKDIRES